MLKKKFEEVAKKLNKEVDQGKISIDQYDYLFNEAHKQFIKESEIDKYSGAKTLSSKGWQYSRNYLNNAGKDITIGYLLDLGYDKTGAEYIEEILRKGGTTLAF